MTSLNRTGVFPAMTTPFFNDGSIDFNQLEHDAKRLESAGVDGLVPTGSTGESATLSHDEHVEVVECVVNAVKNIPIIAVLIARYCYQYLAMLPRILPNVLSLGVSKM